MFLKFESMIEKLIMANYTFFTAINFSRINSFAYINSIVMQHLKDLFVKNSFHQFQEDCHQENLSFACL